MSNFKLTFLSAAFVVALLTLGCYEGAGVASKVSEVPGCNIAVFDDFPSHGKVTWTRSSHVMEIKGSVQFDKFENWISGRFEERLYQEIYESWQSSESSGFIQQFRMTLTIGDFTYHLAVAQDGGFSILIQ